MLPQTMQYVNALSPPIAGERVGLRGGVEMGTYSTKPTCKAPKYDVQFVRSEALRSSRTRQIKECYISK